VVSEAKRLTRTWLISNHYNGLMFRWSKPSVCEPVGVLVCSARTRRVPLMGSPPHVICLEDAVRTLGWIACCAVVITTTLSIMSCGDSASSQESVGDALDAASSPGDTTDSAADSGTAPSTPVVDPTELPLRTCGTEVAPCISCTKNSECRLLHLVGSGVKQTWMAACGDADQCVECDGDGDDFTCGYNYYALGNICIGGLCGCEETEPSACVGNTNGWKCLTPDAGATRGGASAGLEATFCGCESNDDCNTSEWACVDNPYVGGKTCRNIVWPDR
jgi:hypothetical protein